MTITGEQIKAARSLLGWTQSELAGRVGLSRSTVGQFESGTRRLPSFDTSVMASIFDEAGIESEDKGHGVRMRETK